MKQLNRVLLSGASGFLGRALALRLARAGLEVVALVRDPERARGVLGSGPRLLSTSISDAGLRAELAHVDAVVNLAGEPLFGPRWSERRRAELRSSRVATTARLARAIAGAARRPAVFVSGSAVGIWGDRGDEQLDERSSPGQGFLAELCGAWEAAARPAEEAQVRTVLLRTGVVLGAEGGALATMLPPFRLGLGGRLGHGRQWMPWIHIDDWLELVVRALRDESLSGALAATAPEPVRNSEFTRALGQALRRPTPFPVPGVALELVLGEVASLLLTGQRVRPTRALAAGFAFRFPTLAGALEDLVAPDPTVEIGACLDAPDVEYLRQRKPRYQLAQRTLIHAPLEQVFEFFSRSENLGAITPPTMAFTTLGAPGRAMHAGREIDYAIRVGPVPLRWRSRIEVWEPGARFVDSQLEGPYRAWWHEHRFARAGEHTLMEDRVWYAAPLGPLGALAQRWLIAGRLSAIFGYRARAVRWRFGADSARESTGVPH